MFTGIVEELGEIISISFGADSAVLAVKASTVMEGTRIGDSIAINGVCLTVTSLGNNSFKADVMAETLRKTGLGKLKTGGKVNLERALRLSDRMGGHLVSGHVDGVGTIKTMKRSDIAVVVDIEAGPDILRYIIPKGSIAVDGISLTVVDTSAASFRVSLIPHTFKSTSLGIKQVGSIVNLENDIVAKYIEQFVKLKDKGHTVQQEITFDKLKQYGF